MSSRGSSASFQYAKIRVMSASQLAGGGGGGCFWRDVWDTREGFLSLFHVFTVQPAAMHNAIPSDGAFLAAARGGGGSGSNRHIYRVTSQHER